MALRLGEETVADYTLYDIEMRRRLLFAIGILDTHAALDHGTIPVMPSTAFEKPPLYINDRDMSPPNNVSIVSSSFISDMTHTAIVYEAMICHRTLYELSQGASNDWERWPKRLGLIHAFDQHVKGVTSLVGLSTGPLHILLETTGSKLLITWFTIATAKATVQKTTRNQSILG
jgi:hypothetical protein